MTMSGTGCFKFSTIVVVIALTGGGHQVAFADPNANVAGCPALTTLRSALRLRKMDEIANIDTCARGKFPASATVVSLSLIIGVKDGKDAAKDLVVIDDKGRLLGRKHETMSMGGLDRISVDKLETADLDQDGVDEVLVTASYAKGSAKSSVDVARLEKGALVAKFSTTLIASNEDDLLSSDADGTADQSALVECRATHRVGPGGLLLIDTHLKMGAHAPADETVSASCIEGPTFFRIDKTGVSRVITDGEAAVAGPGEIRLAYVPSKISSIDLERAVVASHYGRAANMLFELYSKCDARKPEVAACLQLPEVRTKNQDQLRTARSVLDALAKAPPELRDNAAKLVLRIRTQILAAEAELRYVETWNLDELKRPLGSIDVASKCSTELKKLESASTTNEKYTAMVREYGNCVNHLLPDVDGNATKGWKEFLAKHGVRETRVGGGGM